MKTLFLLLLLCHVSFSANHSLRFFFTGSHGVSRSPDFIGAAVVDDVLMGYCDSDKKIVEPKQELVKMFFEQDPQHLQWYQGECFENQPIFFKATIQSLMVLYNQSGGVHVLQRMDGCEWDDETGKITGYMKYGYDSEDLLSFDLKTSTWIALKPEAVQIKQSWEAVETRNKYIMTSLTHVCPEFLKKYVTYVKSILQRTELPSVSLLQKTPSSPVSCHATGFYPDRALLFWRKDGDELHEDVDHGEILPNPDGTFQMSVVLDLSSVSPDDWRRYDCVFSLSGVEDDIVTRLDKAVIMTNWVSRSEFPTSAVIGVVVGLVLLFGFCIAVFIWRWNNNGFTQVNRSP